jgi:hypothetical protein
MTKGKSLITGDSIGLPLSLVHIPYKPSKNEDFI